MPETRGYEVVAEIRGSVLQDLLLAAWDNGGTGEPGAIPHEVTIAPGTSIGPYVVEAGHVSIPKSGLSLELNPPVNGLTVSLAVAVQVQFTRASVPLESLQLMSADAEVDITAPFGTVPESAPNLGVIFDGLPRNRVSVNLLGGHPAGEIGIQLVREYVHRLYVDGTIPHSEDFVDQSYGGIAFDAHIEIYDDETDPNREILVTQPAPNAVRISLPIYLRLSGLEGALSAASPMGVVSRLILTAPYDISTNPATAALSQATIVVDPITPAPGLEGTRYQTAKSFYSPLDTLITAQLQQRAQTLVNAMPDFEVALPTLTQIQNRIGDEVHAELLTRRYVGVWTPATPEGSPVQVQQADAKAMSDALAIAINPGPSADLGALGSFIPAGRVLAIGLDDDFVESTIQEVVNRPKDEGGFGGIPTTFDNISGHRVDVKSLQWELRSGAIHFSGEVTVHDVFCKADADVGFWADVGLRWTDPDANGAQRLEPFLIASDASLPWWAWLLAILGFIFGIIVGIIGIVIVVVIDQLVDKIGAAFINDEVNDQVQVLGAWPQQLQGVGEVLSTFDRDVLIEPSGLLFTASIEFVATHQAALISSANSNGPYTGTSRQPLSFHAQGANPQVDHRWRYSDGAQGSGNQVSHEFADNGLYVVRLGSAVAGPGGATTHSLTTVRVKNVPPTVHAGADLVLAEGEVFTVQGQFVDPEWVDTHEAIWDFGDDTLPTPGQVQEINESPGARGLVTASHAYCDNGTYTVTLRVRDKDGGVGEDSLTATVRNVAPKAYVDAPLFAYPCAPVTLIAQFVDPGWCDTHTATWKFGDGDHALAPTPATIREVNEPPSAYGIAGATHTYHALGNYWATCTVADDDGAVTRVRLEVIVVDLMNKSFECGFHRSSTGLVANEWRDYVLEGDPDPSTGMATPGDATFDAAHSVLRDGQRCQKLSLRGPLRAGIVQAVGANPGWDYQVTLHYQMVGDRALARLGLDPEGGGDPTSPRIVWTAGGAEGRFRILTTRVTAERRTLTVFVEGSNDAGASECFFDRAEFLPFPCPLPTPQRRAPPEDPRRACLDFATERESRELLTPETRERFTLQSKAKVLRIATWADPNGTGKLVIPPEDVSIKLPFVATKVLVSVSVHAGKPLVASAFDEQHVLVGQAESSLRSLETLTIEGEGIATIEFSGGANEGLLHKLCAETGQRTVAPRPSMPHHAAIEVGRTKRS